MDLFFVVFFFVFVVVNRHCFFFVFVLDGFDDEGDVVLPASKQEPVLASLSWDTHRANV